MQALESGERPAGELRDLLEIRCLATVRPNYLHPAMEQGLVEMTRPDTPTSRLEKYRLTGEGRKVAGGA